jgi:hypothetical protein
LNSSSVFEAIPEGLNVECVWVASVVPIRFSTAASFRLWSLLLDMMVAPSSMPAARRSTMAPSKGDAPAGSVCQCH